MLNYAHTNNASTIVPCIIIIEQRAEPPVLLLPSPFPSHTPDTEREQGQQTGSTEFQCLHARAVQRKGEPLTGNELSALYDTRFMHYLHEWEQGWIPNHWLDAGGVDGCEPIWRPGTPFLLTHRRAIHQHLPSCLHRSHSARPRC